LGCLAAFLVHRQKFDGASTAESAFSNFASKLLVRRDSNHSSASRSPSPSRSPSKLQEAFTGLFRRNSSKGKDLDGSGKLEGSSSSHSKLTKKPSLLGGILKKKPSEGDSMISGPINDASSEKGSTKEVSFYLVFFFSSASWNEFFFFFFRVLRLRWVARLDFLRSAEEILEGQVQDEPQDAQAWQARRARERGGAGVGRGGLGERV
jgi:hypothetical protein